MKHATLRLINRNRLDIFAIAALFTISIVVALITIRRVYPISPIDEITHIDYVWRLMHGEIPHKGDQMTPYSLEVWSCRGQTNLEKVMPACGTSDPSAYPQPENYNAWQPPLFFLAVALMTKVGTYLTALDTVVLMRVSCALLASTGVCALFLVMRYWRVPVGLAAGLSASIVATPAYALTSSTVSTDAPFLLVGSMVMWVLGREVIQGRSSYKLAFVVGAVSAGIKTISASAILIVSVILALTGMVRLRRGESSGWRPIVSVLAAGAGVFLASIIWTRYVVAHTPANWENPLLGASTELLGPGELPFAAWLGTSTRVFGFGAGYWEENVLSTYPGRFASGLVTIALTSAPLVALVKLRGAKRLLTWTALAGPVMVALIVEIQAWVRESAYFGIVSSRYGATLIAATMLALACSMSGEDKTTRFWVAVSGWTVAVLTVVDVLGMWPTI